MADSSGNAGTLRVYVGTYTGGASRGIYLLEMDLESGRLGEPALAAESVNPSFLAIHPNRRFLYAVNEIGQFEGKSAGAVSAFAIDPASGRLTLLNQVSSGGAAPCHISLDNTARNALVANYSGGSVAVLPIARDGKLGPMSAFVQHHGKSVNPSRQEGPHAHSVNLDAGNRFAIVADLGLDQVIAHPFRAARGELDANAAPAAKVAPGSGPRHFAFHPSGKWAYVINELANTVTAFAFDPKSGRLTEIQTIGTLPPDFKGESYTAEVVVSPSGRFLYGSNRGHDSIAIFSIDKATGKLTRVGHESTQGKFPRNFALTPDGRFLLAANQNSDNIVVFQVNQQTGKLTPTGQTVTVGKPVCIRFLAPG